MNDPTNYGPSPMMNWLERFELQGAAREWLKWVGAALMVLDHINTYALAGAHPWMYALGV